MTMMRRQFLTAWTVLGITLTGGLLSACATQGGGARVTAVAPGVTGVDLGGVNITMLSDGAATRPLDANFVRNARLEDVQASLKEAGQPTDKVEVPFTALIANIGSQRILFDAGNGEFGAATAGKLLENMRKAGVDPASITAVVISHFHGDHINGLRNRAGALAFPNARIYVPAPEWNWWMDDARMNATPEAQRGGFNTARRVFGPIANTVIRFEPGAEVLPGVRSIPAFGHTPGHTAFRIDGSKNKLLFWADATNVDLFVRNPDWAVMFDMDPEMARTTRIRLADMAVKEKLLVAGYHLPGAAIGTLAARGKGYDFKPLN